MKSSFSYQTSKHQKAFRRYQSKQHTYSSQQITPLADDGNETLKREDWNFGPASPIEPLWLYGYSYLSIDKTIWGMLLDFEYQLDPNAMDRHVVIPRVKTVYGRPISKTTSEKKQQAKETTPTNIELLQQSFLEYSNANFKECLTTLQELIERKTLASSDGDDRLFILNSLIALFLTVVLNYSTILSTQYQSYHNSMELLKVGPLMLRKLRNPQLAQFFSSLINVSKSNYYRKRKKYKLVHSCCKESFHEYSQTGCVIYSQYILQALATSCMYCNKYDEAIEHYENNLYLFAQQADNVYVQSNTLDYFNRILTFICENEYFLIINKCFNMFNYGVALYEKSTSDRSMRNDVSHDWCIKSRYFIFQAVDMMNQHVSSHHDIIIEKRWLKHMINVFKAVSLKCEAIPMNDCNISIHSLMNKFCEQEDGSNELESKKEKETSPFKNDNYYIMTLNKAIHFVIKESQKQQILQSANVNEDEYLKVKKLVSILPLLKCDPMYSRILLHENMVRSQKQSISESLDYALHTLKSSKLFLSPLMNNNESSNASSESSESRSDYFPSMFVPISLNSTPSSVKAGSPIKLSPLNLSRPSTTNVSESSRSIHSSILSDQQHIVDNNFESKCTSSPLRLSRPVTAKASTFSREMQEKKRLAAIITLQAFFRMVLARRKLRLLQDQLRNEMLQLMQVEQIEYLKHHAATKIQALVRKFLATKRVERIRRDFSKTFHTELEAEKRSLPKEVLLSMDHCMIFSSQ
ncbi:hypothetical protein C9374_003902 [Naegleria lovaniensis]|uniref:Uncharacterized protein n=1 Tax=Naegleria lovaniensis TaxID=51637 RepID=A0AA88H434_NAELO|nr:uncharacterized protein C9374_003902 [Naegleria lovaniensis]KAG2394138.1 hypothetical protein C9374_003902 [Naegleria lovaniensis]